MLRLSDREADSKIGEADAAIEKALAAQLRKVKRNAKRYRLRDIWELAFGKVHDSRPFLLRMRWVFNAIIYGDANRGLPTMKDLYGIAPDITGGKSVEEFLHDIRKED